VLGSSDGVSTKHDSSEIAGLEDMVMSSPLKVSVSSESVTLGQDGLTQ
jgi:hypothetical protein